MGTPDANAANAGGGMRRPGIPPPVLGLLTGLAMWGVARWGLASLSFTMPLQKSVALVLIVAGLTLDGLALVGFFRARTAITPLQPEKASTLVQGGLYRFTRNPMYLGLLVVLSGWALWLGNPVNLLGLVLFVVLINRWQIAPEEQALRHKFGADYDAYCERVRRWL
ncbi:MAG: isoprenylcysteine carboxylmethyltransferase family protein [Pseudomonadota bacterium]